MYPGSTPVGISRLALRLGFAAHGLARRSALSHDAATISASTRELFYFAVEFPGEGPVQAAVAHQVTKTQPTTVQEAVQSRAVDPCIHKEPPTPWPFEGLFSPAAEGDSNSPGPATAFSLSTPFVA